MQLEQLLPVIIAVAIMLLVGFPVHEFSHALAAYRLGDGTAKLFGRLTLNPIAHFDPLGGILLAVTFIGSGGALVYPSQLGVPQGAGTITSTVAAMRQIQFGLKLIF